MALSINSPDFASGGEIPSAHTCEGEDISPELMWSGSPAEAVTLALVVDDPDAPDPAAPQRTWVHWVVYDIPPDTPGLPRDARRHGLPAGAREGRNDWQRAGWGGPCPPRGRHRYFFRLFALDEQLGDRGELTKAELERAMTNHVLATAELVGTYEKQGR